MHSIKPLRIGLVALACCLAAPSPAYAQPTGYDGYQVVRIAIASDDDLQVLQNLEALWPDVEVWSEVAAIGPVDVRIAPAALPLLDASGLCYTVIVEDLQQHIDELYGLRGERNDDFFDSLRTYDEHVQFMSDLVAAYPDLAQMVSLGDSVLGRPLWALRITGPRSDKPGVMYHGAQHGDEQAGASVVAFAAHHLLTDYASDPEVAALVDDVEWFLLPIMNPDGYENWRRLNAHGVDLNRNWDGPGSTRARMGGPFQFSEPETAALRDFFAAYPNVRVHVDFHGYIPCLMWPWGHTHDLTCDHWTFYLLGSEVHDLLFDAGGGDYEFGAARHVSYEVCGGSIDYSYGELGVWSFVFELVHSQLPRICEEFLPTMLFLSGWISDCNGNSTPDADDIDAGSSTDCDLNGVPDECESQRDCNNDGVLDVCDFAAGAPDCNGNAIPDACDIADGTSADCNANWVPDECEPDCNGNDIADECDIADGTSEDCTGNGIPDECEPDCNENGVADSCDIADGTAEDCDDNGAPDECELDGVTGINLERTLLLLNANHATIAGLVPNCFDFVGGETGDEIEDGGQNMYDGGNRLNTNRAWRIPYTNGVIMPADAEFGPGSRYFTAKYPGLFIMIAADISIDWFTTLGNLGADGLGQAHGKKFTTELDELQYTIFLKRVFAAGTPSVNHILIVRGDGEGTRHGYYNDDTDSDLDALRRLAGVQELIYILVATQDGEELHDTDTLEIAVEALQHVALIRQDCDGNSIPDACDIADGSSRDVNANGVPDECECWGDVSGDNQIDWTDLRCLLAHYGQASNASYDSGDLDLDGDIDLADLAELLGHYGETCN